MAQTRRRTVELARAEMLSSWVRSLVFRVADGDAPLAFEAGQYVDVYARAANGFVFKRPYSIASAPRAGGAEEIEIAVTLVEDGPTSTALHAMPIGARAEIDEPRGVFTMRGAREEPALFIATGSGLAPLRSMLADDLAQDAGGARALLFGCRTEKDILWQRELDAWARGHARFRLDVTLSRGGEAWTGRRGYVQTHAREIVAAMGGAPNVYVCGLSKMTDEVTRVLERDAGIDRARIYYETYN
jgi:CDP-4-dehydro-6-deoxyglucose reductase